MALASVIFLTGCYSVRPSSGAGQATASPRRIHAADIALPPGFRIEAIATSLTFPTGVTFDGSGTPVIVESGYSYGEVFVEPRLIAVSGGTPQVIARGTGGPWTGVSFYENNFYVAAGDVQTGGKILRITPGGTISIVVDHLPSRGDHHTNGPVIGPDGWLYFAQGTATNSGVVGEDNFRFGWMKRFPEFHDIPGQDITLAGVNFTTDDPRGGEKVTTGAFLPFGTASRAGQVIEGSTRCAGSVLRVRLTGGEPELIAWGLRNPFGLAFAENGRLFVTENGYDDRGSRPLWGTPDFLWEIEPGAWYGFPDFVGGEPVTADKFRPPGKPQPQFVLAQHPQEPPKPRAIFPVHSSADGFDFSRNEAFGHKGQAFVALFGDETPATGKTLAPVGCSVVRVDLATGVVEDFVTNRGKVAGPASRIGGGGIERPVAARFSPDGRALYIVDFGVMLHHGQGAKPQQGTGVLWRVTREGPP